MPSERTHHGDTFVDEYAWLADKDNPETIAYLEAENAYTEALTAGLAGLRATIFDEIKARTQETDLSVPSRKGGWWYYTRTVEGKQYAVQCRRGWCPATTAPPDDRGRRPAGGRGGPARRERAGRRRHVLLAGHVRRQPGRPPAGVLDRLRGRRAVHLAGQGPGHRRGAADEMPGTFYGGAWSADGARAVLRHGRRGVAAVPGVAAHHRHPGGRATCWCSRSRTSGSGSASA